MSELYSNPADPVDVAHADGHGDVVIEEKSPGVRRIEAVSSCFTAGHRIVLFVSIFFVAYAYGLDGTLRYTYQNYALEEWNNQALISSVNVARAVVAAAIQPVYAKISDYFGRVTVLAISVLFYMIGTIVSASANSVSTFAGGNVLYQFGYSGIILLVEILIADTTALRSRVFFSYIPALPFLINTWVAGDVASATMGATSWRWGYGMWAIIFPVLCIPLFASLISAEIRAARKGLLNDIPSPYRNIWKASMWNDFFWQADIGGLFFLAATLALILLPLTLAGGSSSLWKTAKILAPLLIGICVALPCFVLWEAKVARHPFLPLRLLRQRHVLCALGIALFLNTSWYTQGDYLYTTLLVAFGKGITEATRVTNIYSFCSTLVGVALGLAVRWIRRLKPFVIAGALGFVLAFGLLIRYRGGHSVSDFAGLVGAEVVLGIAGGLLPYPTQALMQAAVSHERTAIVTGVYLATYNIGSGLGNTIAGAIWTNKMPGHIYRNMVSRGVSNATALAADAFGTPTVYITQWAVGTPERDAVDAAYREVQRYLTIAGICFSCLLVLFSLGLKNPRLGDEQSLRDAEKDSVHSEETLTEEAVGRDKP